MDDETKWNTNLHVQIWNGFKHRFSQHSKAIQVIPKHEEKKKNGILYAQAAPEGKSPFFFFRC